MSTNSGIIANCVLVANPSQVGPSYIADAVDDFFTHDQQMLFASRIIVLTGMGHQKTPEGKIQGSVPVAEPTNYEGEFEFLFFQRRPNNPKYGNLHLVYVILFESSNAALLRSLIPEIEKEIASFQISLEGFEDGIFDKSRRPYFTQKMQEFQNILNDLIDKKPPENSIFDIAFVTSLIGKKQEFAKKLMGSPTGIKVSQLKEFESVLPYFIDQRMVFFEGEGEDQVIKGR